MLLSIKYDVINSLDIKLAFDDGNTKEEHVSIGDVVDVSYNKNGCKKSMEGIVKQIVTGQDPCKRQTWYMIVDASNYGRAMLEKIEIGKILDLEVIRKGAGLMTVHTPSNRMKVTDIRMNGSFLQMSPDYGKHWYNVTEIKPTTYDVPDEFQELAARIDSLLPKHMNPGVKSDLVVALVQLFRDVNPEELDIRRIEEKLDNTIEEVVENSTNIDYISKIYALADQGDEGYNGIDEG